MAVDRNKLKALGGETLAEMVKTDELELLYLHVQSMRNFTLVKDRLLQNRASKAVDGAASNSAPEGREGGPNALSQANLEPASIE